MIAVTVFGAGCSKEESSVVKDSNELKVTTNIVKPSTKSTVSSFNNSTIGIYVDDDADKYTPSTNSIAIVSNGDNSVIVKPSIYINADATVYAWYPAKTGELANPTSTSATDITVLNTDDFSATGQNDYLIATPVSVTEANRTAALTLKHALSKIIFSIKKDADFEEDGVLSAISLTSTGTPFLSGTDGTMTIEDGTISALTSTSTLKYTGSIILSTTAAKIVALVAPTTLNETITIKLTIDDNFYSTTFPVTEVSTWDAATEYTYNITAYKGELKIGIVTITPWATGTTTDIPVK